MDDPGGQERRGAHDLRLLVVGAAAWAGAGGARLGGWWPIAAAAGVATVAWLGRRRLGAAVLRTVIGALLVLAAVATVTVLRLTEIADGPVARLARDRAAVQVMGTVVSDPREVTGRFADLVVVRLQVREVTGRGTTVSTTAPVLVIGDAEWREVPLGERVQVSGRLGPADDPDLAAVLSARGPPSTLDPPDLWWRGAGAVRAGIRAAVAHRPADQRALVPALVDGDDDALDDALADDFRATGLTHLLAVSGTNLTLVVGFLLILTRWVGVRGRWLLLVGAVGIVGFVLLARTEPSVLRAAVMGTVGLLAMGTDGRRRGSRAIGVAVVALLLVRPELAVQAGFALSVLATAGIVLVAPAWRDALARWLPRWAAEAVAVPAAAQLACTPVVAAISGQVSLVAVIANLVVAPVVGPATVLGLGGGVLALLWEPAGRLLGALAGWCVAWIVVVATRGADLPGAAIGWGTGPVALAALTVLTMGLVVLGPRLLRRPTTGIACSVVLVLVVAVRPPALGWPPDGWVLVACDVGQGDALVVRAGPGAGVVVDAGPDPGLVDRCLDRLGIEAVPLLVLTHFHADHVDGLPGVLDGRDIGTALTTRLLDPPEAAATVDAELAAVGVAPVRASSGMTVQAGEATVEVLWPDVDSPTQGPGDGSTANEASVVLLARVRGVRMLLTGDIEPEGQAALARALPGLQADVLKVPHHGSRYQDEPWLLSLGARLALVSVGADNDYGHPAATALDPLTAAGVAVLRTDRDGDVAVVEDGGRLSVETQ